MAVGHTSPRGLTLRRRKTGQWGAQPLREALETITAAAVLGGGQIIVVDAHNAGLITWYERQGFKPTGGDLRMYVKVATTRRYLRADTRNRRIPRGVPAIDLR
jgi:hypothetical protein